MAASIPEWKLALGLSNHFMGLNIRIVQYSYIRVPAGYAPSIVMVMEVLSLPALWIRPGQDCFAIGILSPSGRGPPLLCGRRVWGDTRVLSLIVCLVEQCIDKRWQHYNLIQLIDARCSCTAALLPGKLADLLSHT